MDEKEFVPSFKHISMASRQVRLENAWPCSNKLIKIINVIYFFSLLLGQEIV